MLQKLQELWKKVQSKSSKTVLSPLIMALVPQ